MNENSHARADEIDEILSRGVAQMVDPGGVFRDKLLKKSAGEYENDIIIKFGVDPTRPDIHLGHAVVLRKLRALQELGCKVVFLVGDLTAQIGDPTGKSKTRPELAYKEIEKNMQTYLEQIGKILKTDEKYFSWITNSDWYASPFDIDLGTNKNGTKNPELAFKKYWDTRRQVTVLQKEWFCTISLFNVLAVLRRITHARLIERDMFQERKKSGKELYMHEMLYPVLQGIDSDVIARIYDSCDLEIGGTDQTFNMLMGRDVMRIGKQEEQAVMAMDILAGTDGVEKMSKSLDNYIGITDAPSEMYGKVMSVPDAMVPQYAELCTDMSRAEIEEMKKAVAEGSVHPRDAKMRLAREIVALYHSTEEARRAESDFVRTFQKGGIPEEVEEVSMNGETLMDTLLRAQIITSKNEWRRLLDQGGVKDAETGEKIVKVDFVPARNHIYKIGKHRFIKVV